jgi:hypothetical protein
MMMMTTPSVNPLFLLSQIALFVENFLFLFLFFPLSHSLTPNMFTNNLLAACFAFTHSLFFKDDDLRVCECWWQQFE